MKVMLGAPVAVEARKRSSTCLTMVAAAACCGVLVMTDCCAVAVPRIEPIAICCSDEGRSMFHSIAQVSCPGVKHRAVPGVSELAMRGGTAVVHLGIDLMDHGVVGHCMPVMSQRVRVRVRVSVRR